MSVSEVAGRGGFSKGLGRSGHIPQMSAKALFPTPAEETKPGCGLDSWRL